MLLGLAVIASCFLVWVIIPARDIVVSGIRAEGTNFGSPGYFTILMGVLFLAFHFISRVWAKRANLVVAALNLAWALRNYFLISTCIAGECPVKQPGIYLMLASSALLMVIALFPDIRLPETKAEK